MSRTLVPAARRWLLLVGVALAAAALLSVVAAVIDAPWIESFRWPGDDTLLVAAFVTTTVTACALVVTVDWVVDGSDAASVPPESTPETTPESTSGVPRVGGDIDAVVTGWLPASVRSPEERRRHRDRLRRTAVRTVERTGDVTDDSAEELVECGEWTDDPVAAAFLGRPASPGYLRLCDRVARSVADGHRVRRSVRAIAAVATDGVDE